MSQYPVFPWIHLIFQKLPQKYTNIFDLSIYRDLSKNMGLLGTEKWKQHLESKYEEEDPYTEDRYHHGSHYSHPGIIIQNLVWITPYFEGMMSLQKGDIDAADWLFFNLERTLNHALVDNSDVWECLPE